MSMNILNQRILEIWLKYSDIHELTKRYPLLYHDMKKKQSIFIGLNPSYSAKIIPILRNKGFYDNKNERKIFFDWNGDLSYKKVKRIIAHDSYCMCHYDTYYKPLNVVAKAVNLTMQSIDLFGIRKTKQSSIKSLIKIHPKFFIEQMKLSRDIVDFLEPKIIFVVNAYASDLIHENKTWSESLLPFSEERGYFSFLLNKEKKVPILFSSMLSGQRRLDKYSFQRLIWHSKKAYNENL